MRDGLCDTCKRNAARVDILTAALKVACQALRPLATSNGPRYFVALHEQLRDALRRSEEA